MVSMAERGSLHFLSCHNDVGCRDNTNSYTHLVKKHNDNYYSITIHVCTIMHLILNHCTKQMVHYKFYGAG